MTGNKATKGMALLLTVAALMVGVPGCGGGGFVIPGGAGIANLVATILGVTPVTGGSGETIVRIDYQVTGQAAQTFGLTFQYAIDANNNGILDPAEAALAMTEVSTAVEMSFGVLSENGSGLSPLATGTAAGAFYWQAGADLGFVGATVFAIVTPTNGQAGQTIVIATSNAFTYAGGSPAVTVGGGNIGSGAGTPGRAEHTAHSFPGAVNPGVLAVGGVDGAMTPVNGLDRFDIDLGNRMHTLAFGGIGQNVRRDHASAFYFDGTNIKVLVTGGDVAGSASNTADIYCFSPTEQVSSAANMLITRRRHAACWLPNNNILITGGDGGSAISAEVYNPVTDTFTLVANMLRARADHTCCLLPDGRVLVAGGRDPAAPTMPLPADIFDPATGTWTTTNVTIDRYQHTATLLVNGVCMLIGGRRVSDDAVIATVDYFRSFQDVDQVTGANLPAGFTSGASAALASARAEHASSRLGTTQVLVSGGFDATNPGATLATAEVFIPDSFTSFGIGAFSSVNSMTTGRARHSSTTVEQGSNVIIGGVTGTLGAETVLNTIEAYQFSNSAPSVASGSIAVTGQADADVPVSFSVADAENDRCFVYARFSVDGGTTFSFCTLNDYQAATNLAPGNAVVSWNAAADGVMPGQSVVIQIIPIGGVIGTPSQNTAQL